MEGINIIINKFIIVLIFNNIFSADNIVIIVIQKL